MSLDVFQQVFSLSLISNAVNDRTGTQANLQAALTVLVNGAVPLVGDWKVVWGPVVWKNSPDDANTGPDNSWYIAYNPSLAFEDGSVHPTYVVAVAGTANKTTYAWTEENFAVDSVIDFKLWVANGITEPPVETPPKDVIPGGQYVAAGTAKAVQNLLMYPAPSGTASAGTSLLDFLCNIDVVEDTRVVFTGHSLGGALSPTLALAIVASGVLGQDGVLVYPSAGASPGNSGFAEFFAQTFPARQIPASVGGYQVWNLNLVNTLDIVPQAWCTIPSISPAQNIDNIPTIYGKPAVMLVRGAAFLMKLQAFRSGVIYVPLPSHLVTGTPPEAPPTTVQEFLTLAMQQHGTFYINLLRIPVPPAKEGVLLEYGLGEKTESEKLLEYPVIANVEWAAENPDQVKSAIETAKASDPEAAASLRIKD